MTFSKQIFSLLFFFVFPLQHASNPKKCSSSFSTPFSCGPLEVPIRFPFCDHSRFNLNCNDLNKTVLELPMSGSFLVGNIDYRKQQIYINDPENCMVKRFLNFNISGSPFSSRFDILYTFLTCPNELVLPSSYRSIPCLSNSTSSFYATSNYAFAKSMLPSCNIVQRVSVPASSPFGEVELNQSLLLEWHSPNCRSCEMDDSRCGFKNNASFEVKCFGANKSGHISNGVLVLIISLSIIGAVSVFPACILMRIYNSQIFDSSTRYNEAIAAATVREQTRRTMVRTGLDQFTIDSFKKMELGESKRLPGTNGIVCPICLSEYASKETVRFIPECNHCFHVDCVDVWLKIHGSCPLCRKTHAYRST